EKKVHGYLDEEFNVVCEVILDEVVDWLLGPMQDVTPVLVHGNIWDDNARMIRGTTSAVALLNPTPLWAPAEYEWAPWWTKTNSIINRDYIDKHVSHPDCVIPEPRKT
ncbi:hypothetical protein QBC41DRAFT_235001, partial [Cercophora samala]